MGLPQFASSHAIREELTFQKHAISWQQHAATSGTWSSRNLLHHQQQALVPWISRMHGIWTSGKNCPLCNGGTRHHGSQNCALLTLPSTCGTPKKNILENGGIIGNHWNLRFFPQLSIIKALASPTSTLSELFTTRMSPLPQ